MDFDTIVKLEIYETIAKTSCVPTSHDVAHSLRRSVSEVEGAFAHLHAQRLLVPEPGDISRIRMAPPFSGVETPFRVRVGERAFYANCIWDALGIPAALHADATIDASDGHTGEPMTLEVRGQKPIRRECVIHFAVPAALWWRDVIYT